MVGMILAPAPVRTVSARPEELRRQARFAGASSVATQSVKQVILRDPVIDAARNTQRLCERWLRRIKIACDQRGGAQIHEHHRKTVRLICLAAEPHALSGCGSGCIQVAHKKTIQCSRLQQPKAHGDLVNFYRCGFRLIE